MTTTADQPLPPPAIRRRLITLGLLQAFGITVALTVLYYLAPLDHLGHVPLWASMTVALLALSALTAYHTRAIRTAAHPGIRAVTALATTVPLFLILFSATYFLMAQDSASNFNVHTLTRTDALYFTITVFSSVGFGDITATSKAAMVLVMLQMVLDLVVVGLVIRLFVGAVRDGRLKDPEGGWAGEPN
jgi:hypothetical protein